MGLIVYGANMSPFVRKVRVMLAEKGVDYSLEQVNPFSPPPEFLKISPLEAHSGAARHGPAGAQYAAGFHGDLRLPRTQISRAGRFIRPIPFERARRCGSRNMRIPRWPKPSAAGSSSSASSRSMLRQQPDEAICATTLTEKIPPVFDYLESAIGENDYSSSAEPSPIADIAVGTMLVNFEHAGETPDAEALAEARRLYRAHSRQTSFKACIDEERPQVARVRAHDEPCSRQPAPDASGKSRQVTPLADVRLCASRRCRWRRWGCPSSCICRSSTRPTRSG